MALEGHVERGEAGAGGHPGAADTGGGIVKRSLILGTRGSALALAQVGMVREALGEAGLKVPVEVRKITTSGDRKLDVSLAPSGAAGLKGLFTREIEEVLRAGEIDAAVHSLKDLPGQPAEGLVIAAVLPRGSSADVLVTRDGCRFAELPIGAVIGTSSVRRACQLRRLRPDLVIEDFRGNVPTRLKKLRDDELLSGIVLAQAGLDRLGLNSAETGLSFESLGGMLLPAVGQGIVALQARADDAETVELLKGINDADTWCIMRAERELLRLLDGDCWLPVGVRTQLAGDAISLEAVVFDQEDGTAREGAAKGPRAEPEAVAQTLYSKLYGD